MPALLPLLGGLLLSLVGSIVFRVLVALGIGYTTFNGANYLMDQFTSLIDSSLVSISPEILQAAALLKLGVCINILISAYTIRMALMGFNHATGALAMWMITPKAN